MSVSTWLLVHLVAVSVLAGVGWVVQLVVYPAFALVGPGEWAAYHAHHTRAVTQVVALPWVVQGASTVALLLVAPAGARPAVVVLAALGLATVIATVAGAVPAHGRLGPAAGASDARELVKLLRANMIRTLAWTAAVVLAATMSA